MSALLPRLRPVLRPRAPRLPRSRYSSTTPNPSSTSSTTTANSANATLEATQKRAQDALANLQKNETVQATQKKAAEALGGLSQAAARLWATGKTYLGPAGERLGNAMGSYKDPLIYNAAVAKEFLKQVYVAEGLAPPTSTATVKQAFSTLWSRASSLGYWRQSVASGDIARLGIYAVEAYGIFKIGEIVGRRSLLGYPLPPAAH